MRPGIIGVVTLLLVLAGWGGATAWGLDPPIQQAVGGLARELSGEIARLQKRVVAVGDFTDLQGRATELGRFLAEELVGALLREGQGLQVVDRIHLARIIQEQRLAAVGLTEPGSVRTIGRLTGADVLVVGTTTPLGDNVRVTVKALAADTGRVVAAAGMTLPKTPGIAALLMQPVADGGAVHQVAASPSPAGTSVPPAAPPSAPGVPPVPSRASVPDAPAAPPPPPGAGPPPPVPPPAPGVPVIASAAVVPPPGGAYESWPGRWERQSILQRVFLIAHRNARYAQGRCGGRVFDQALAIRGEDGSVTFNLHRRYNVFQVYVSVDERSARYGAAYGAAAAVAVDLDGERIRQILARAGQGQLLRVQVTNVAGLTLRNVRVSWPGLETCWGEPAVLRMIR
ncbi:MAG: hypothetical protein HY660_14175 [Armatimonadetes bacterium]|nr:hypothetical protein [Armatimonadota bacterium]